MEQVSSMLSNTGSVIAIVIGIVVIIGMVSVLIMKGKLNIQSDKFSIESSKQNTKSLLAECRQSCSLMAYEFAQKWIDKHPKSEYQIMYTAELVLNRIENMLHYNSINSSQDYIDMRFTDIKAIIDRNRIPEAEYSEQFYKELYDTFCKMIKQIILIKKHYNDGE